MARCTGCDGSDRPNYKEMSTSLLSLVYHFQCTVAHKDGGLRTVVAARMATCMQYLFCILLHDIFPSLPSISLSCSTYTLSPSCPLALLPPFPHSLPLILSSSHPLILSLSSSHPLPLILSYSPSPSHPLIFSLSLSTSSLKKKKQNSYQNCCHYRSLPRM